MDTPEGFHAGMEAICPSFLDGSLQFEEPFQCLINGLNYIDAYPHTYCCADHEVSFANVGLGGYFCACNDGEPCIKMGDLCGVDFIEVPDIPQETKDFVCPALASQENRDMFGVQTIDGKDYFCSSGGIMENDGGYTCHCGSQNPCWYLQQSCPENYPMTATGDGDPHFSGFHLEKMDIIHDSESAERLITLFCTPDVSINVYLAETVSGLLFMSQAFIQLGGQSIVVDVDGLSVFLNDELLSLSVGEHHSIDTVEISRKEQADNGLVVIKLAKDLQVNVKAGIYKDAAEESAIPYLFVGLEALPVSFPLVSGLLGQTLHEKLSDEQFNQFKRFFLEKDADSLTCDVFHLLS